MQGTHRRNQADRLAGKTLISQVFLNGIDLGVNLHDKGSVGLKMDAKVGFSKYNMWIRGENFVLLCLV